MRSGVDSLTERKCQLQGVRHNDHPVKRISSGRIRVRRRRRSDHIITQLQPCAGGAYGSSFFPTGPHTDGT